MNTKNEVRSEKTQQEYFLRGDRLSTRAVKYYGTTDISYCDTVKWLMTIKPTLRKSSWRLYRCSFNFYLEGMLELEDDASTRQDIRDALRNLGNIDSADDEIVCHPPRTSSSKKKSVSYMDFSRIHEWMLMLNVSWSEETILWLYATILTGLRPIEWRNAILTETESDLPILIVRNAKSTNGRSHGVSRVLHLEMVDTEGLQFVKDHLSMVTELCSNPKIGWDRYYAGVRNALYRTNLELWPNRKCRISLYSARHQFAADAKLAGYTKQEVAAMMGHASDLTAGRHYGKKRSGHIGFSVMPDQADVARVRSPTPSSGPTKMRMR